MSRPQVASTALVPELLREHARRRLRLQLDVFSFALAVRSCEQVGLNDRVVVVGRVGQRHQLTSRLGTLRLYERISRYGLMHERRTTAPVDLNGPHFPLCFVAAGPARARGA